MVWSFQDRAKPPHLGDLGRVVASAGAAGSARKLHRCPWQQRSESGRGRSGQATRGDSRSDSNAASRAAATPTPESRPKQTPLSDYELDGRDRLRGTYAG